MTHTKHSHARVLAVAPSTRGVGFAAIEAGANFIEWGVKTIPGDKNVKSLERVEFLIRRCKPTLLVFEDFWAQGSRRQPRIRALGKQILELASKNKIKTAVFSLEQVRKAYTDDGKITKHEIAEKLAKAFPHELKSMLPSKRKAWMSQHSSSDIFDAASLALMPMIQNQNYGFKK